MYVHRCVLCKSHTLATHRYTRSQFRGYDQQSSGVTPSTGSLRPSFIVGSTGDAVCPAKACAHDGLMCWGLLKPWLVDFNEPKLYSRLAIAYGFGQQSIKTRCCMPPPHTLLRGHQKRRVSGEHIRTGDHVGRTFFLFLIFSIPPSHLFLGGMPKFPCPNSRYAPGCWWSPPVSMVKSTFELLKSKSTRWQAHTDPYVAALRKRLLGAAPEPPVALSNIQMYPAVRGSVPL